MRAMRDAQMLSRHYITVASNRKNAESGVIHKSEVVEASLFARAHDFSLINFHHLHLERIQRIDCPTRRPCPRRDAPIIRDDLSIDIFSADRSTAEEDFCANDSAIDRLRPVRHPSVSLRVNPIPSLVTPAGIPYAKKTNAELCEIRGGVSEISLDDVLRRAETIKRMIINV